MPKRYNARGKRPPVSMRRNNYLIYLGKKRKVLKGNIVIIIIPLRFLFSMKKNMLKINSRDF